MNAPGAKRRISEELRAAYSNAILYRAPGPISEAFLADRHFIAGIMGPIGSAKTSTCLVKPLHIGMEQAPNPRDGWRRSRFVVVRDTYTQPATSTAEWAAQRVAGPPPPRKRART